MGIDVADSALSLIREQPDQIVVDATAPNAVASARSALAAARRDIVNLNAGSRAIRGQGAQASHGIRYVSSVLPTPQGGALLIDGGQVSQAALQTIPEIIARHLMASGIDEALIAAPPEGSQLVHLNLVPRAVILRLGAAPTYRRGKPRVVPQALVESAALWLCEGMLDDDLVRVAMGGIEFTVAVSGVGDVLASAHRSRVVRCTAVAGNLDHRIRAVSGCFSRGSIALAAGGPAADDHDLAGDFSSLKDFARRNTQGISYAFIDVAATFDAITQVTHPTDWAVMGGEDPMRVERACDEALFDAFPYQLIGSRHVARLGGMPRDARPLRESELVELEVGELSAWMPDDPGRAVALATARKVLAPCLMQPNEAAEIVRRRTREMLSQNDS